jgi:transposase
VLGSGRSNKNDANDALSVALTALRNRALRPVAAVDHRDVLPMLARRNTDLGDQRSRVVSRRHALLIEMRPGGIAKEINASDVHAFLAAVSPASPVGQTRYDLAVELLDDIERLDAQMKASRKRIRDAVAASNTTVTDIYGVGPILAAALIGYSGDISRFPSRDHYAAHNGTAPGEFSSGGHRAPALAAREPQAQPRHPHGGHLPNPAPGL